MKPPDKDHLLNSGGGGRGGKCVHEIISEKLYKLPRFIEHYKP